MVEKMGKKDRKAILIFSLIWVVICALFSLCGSEFYLPCLICAAFVVGFAWLAVPINSLEVAAERREAERKERAKNKPPRAPIWPVIRKILGFAAIAIAILVVIGCIKAGVSYFIDEYGMVAFLLLVIILLRLI